jgi:molybdopterin-guanine dinucleotide biosynthesis protein A
MFMMSAIVLAGGVSRRLGEPKGLTVLGGTPLILHVLNKIAVVAGEVVIVVSSEGQRKRFAAVVREMGRIVVDKRPVQTPLAGAQTGFETALGEYALLLACDTPFLSPEVLSFLLEASAGRNAAIPRWPNGNIEPLQAAYRVEAAARAAEEALNSGKLDMRSMLAHTGKIRYISTIVLRDLDPALRTFFNINTPNDLRVAEALIGSQATLKDSDSLNV